jgi:phosphoglycolate phosphatase-like HAD superfamily hydrolase
VQVAEARLGRALDLDRAYVVGDTVHDIEAGRAIGARTIAVVFDQASRDGLAAHEPWALLDTLEPRSFFLLIGLTSPS